MLIKIISATSLFISTLFAQSYIFINANTGDDLTGDGSSGAPYKTFTKGYAEASNGDTLDCTGVFDWTDVDETGDEQEWGFIIYKPLIIIGNGADQTIFQAQSTAGVADRSIFSIYTFLDVAFYKCAFRYGSESISGYGGAIYIDSVKSLFIEDCYFYENNATYGGGALDINSSTNISIWNCTFYNNSSEDGAAIYSYNSTLYIQNSTFWGNVSTNSGRGAGLFLYNGLSPTYITNCTIVNNHSTHSSGGIFLYGNGLEIKNTILADNQPGDFYTDSESVNDNGYNIVEFSTGHTWNGTGTLSGNQGALNVDTTLLVNNAPNAVPTLKLLSGSVAIDAGNASNNSFVSIPMQDQRGAFRNGTVDIGAYEFWDNDGSLPVALTAFKATALKSNIKIEWQTASELNNAAFILERKTEGQNFRQIAQIKGAGNSSSTNFYQIIDSTVMAGATYFYRLSDIDFSGKRTYHAHILSTALNKSTLPQAVELYNNYPNPFNPHTTISFSIPSSIKSDTKLFIYNILGEIVWGHNFGILNPGLHSYNWDTRNNTGQLLPSGIYFYILKLNGKQFTKKMTLLR